GQSASRRRRRSRYRRDSTRSAALAMGGRRAELSRLSTIAHASWADPLPPVLAAAPTARLGGGGVRSLPDLRFLGNRDEQAIFSPSILASSKNPSFDPVSGRVGGTTL